jgi:hypothetical protein
MKTLVPYFKTLQKEQEEKIIEMRKERYLLKYLERIIPDEAKVFFRYSLSSLGQNCTRCFLYFSKDTKQEDMQIILPFFKKMKTERWKIDKFFREESGTFSYKMQRDYKSGYITSNFIVFYEDAPNIDGCEIKKKTVKKEVYYSDCGELEKQL